MGCIFPTTAHFKRFEGRIPQSEKNIAPSSTIRPSLSIRGNSTHQIYSAILEVKASHGDVGT